MERLQNMIISEETVTTRPLSPKEKIIPPARRAGASPALQVGRFPTLQGVESTPLQANDISVLTWFDYPGLTRIGVHAAYSMLHSLFLTFYKPYITGFIGDMPLDQRSFINSSFPVFGGDPLLYPERLQLNVFIFDQESKNVYLLGDSFQTERTNVLLYKNKNVYSALGVNVATSGEYPTLQTTFESNHELIQRLVTKP